MKHFFSVITLGFISFTAAAQQSKFNGTWEGDLDAGIQKLRLVFTISGNSDGTTRLLMQSPQQSAMQMPADTAFIQAETIEMEMKKFQISFSGKLINDSTIEGEFTQGRPFPLKLKKVEKASSVSKPKRPQTPRPPFPYKNVEVSFSNKHNTIQFGGTLSLPDTAGGTKYPAVILISGSGAQDRDETILGHKPFAVIADYLTRQGFAVLRVDDRGVGKTTGDHSIATSADFADDKEAALDYLQSNKWIDKNRIGLIGHSEGGMIAPLLAAKRPDVKAIVLLAGPGIKGSRLLTEQVVAIFKSNGTNAAMTDAYGKLYEKIINAIGTAKDSSAAFSNTVQLSTRWNADDSTKKLFKVYSREEIDLNAKEMVEELYSPWFRYFLTYEPSAALKKLRCDVLALNGSKDIQVLPQSNMEGIQKALAGGRARSYEIKEVEGVNHLFQSCKTCTTGEYDTLEESFSPAVLEIMSNWLLQKLK